MAETEDDRLQRFWAAAKLGILCLVSSVMWRLSGGKVYGFEGSDR